MKMYTKKVNNLQKIKTYFPIIYFSLLSLVILLPILVKKGFILSFDVIFTPEMNPGESFNFFNLYRYILHYDAKFIPAEILQKVLFFLLFLGIGYLGYRLAKYIFKTELTSIILGTIYLINPFVYERFVAGHWLFLAGYALTPLFVEMCIKLFTTPNYSRNLKSLLILWAMIPFISKHHFLLWGVIFFVFSTWSLINEIRIYKSVTNISKKASLNIVLNIMWIAFSTLYAMTLDFKSDELLYFSTSGGYLGLLVNLLTFNGFWAEDTIMDHIFDLSIFTYYPWILFLTIFILGLLLLLIPKASYIVTLLEKKINLKKDKLSNTINHYSTQAISRAEFNKVHEITLPLIVITFIGLVLSFGSYEVIGQVYRFFIDDFPLLRGMREPQKFLNLYIVGFMLLTGTGLKAIEITLGKIKNKKFLGFDINLSRALASIVLLSIVLLASYPIFYGASGQVKSLEYPSIYSKVNEHLKSKTKETNLEPLVVVLPWESHSNFRWTEGVRLVNPARRYFSARIIATETPLIRSSEGEITEKCDVEFIYNPGFEDGKAYKTCFLYSDSPLIFYNTLKLLKIDYIFINKVNDSQEYALFDNAYFIKVVEDENGVLYEIAK